MLPAMCLYPFCPWAQKFSLLYSGLTNKQPAPNIRQSLSLIHKSLKHYTEIAFDLSLVALKAAMWAFITSCLVL